MNDNKEEIKKIDDRPIKISDYKKQILDFIKLDDRKYILLFELIQQSDRDEAEVLERMFLKLFDYVRETMLTSDVYTKKDLADVNFFLQMVKLHIQHEGLDMHHPVYSKSGRF